MDDDYTGEPFRSRGISATLAEARGYRRYAPGELEPIFGADERLRAGTYIDDDGKEKRFLAWVRKYARTGGWAMPKHRIPASPFPGNPLLQLRPDDPVPGRKHGHDHAGMLHRERDCPCGIRTHKRTEYKDKQGTVAVYVGGWPNGEQQPLGTIERELHERGSEHNGEDAPPIEGPHAHVEMAKYAVAPGPHGKRWDTHPALSPSDFLNTERLFLHLEGVLKLDSLISAGEVGIDVPSVTLWNRTEGDLSEVDYPDPGGGFWSEFRPTHQTQELMSFLDACAAAPIIILCDSDWHTNPAVAIEAFCLRDVVRDRGLGCVVAAPPDDEMPFLPNRRREKLGSDDFFARDNGFPTGTPDDLLVVEPTEPPAFAGFARSYARVGAGKSGRRRPADTVDFDLSVLRWLLTHSTATGFVKRPASTIARRLNVSDDAVYDATSRLIGAGAVNGDVDAPYTRLLNRRYIRDARGRLRNVGPGHKGGTPVLRLHPDLRPTLDRSSVGEWVKTAERRPLPAG
jgi:hypothetical protein